MAGGLGPRFALEAAFLILLAAVAAYARLEAAEIILVMAGGWLVASIFEILAARRERLYPGAIWERRTEAEEAPAESVETPAESVETPAERDEPPAERDEPPAERDEPRAERDELPETGGRFSWSRRPPSEAVPDEEVVPVAPEAASQSRPAEQTDEATGEIELPGRRRWFRRSRTKPEVPADAGAYRPSARHVRLIRGSPPHQDPEERQDAEAGS
jgi:hypothetical protein